MDISSYLRQHYKTPRQMRGVGSWISIQGIGYTGFLVPILSNILCPESPFTKLLYTHWYLLIIFALFFIIFPILRNCFCARNAYIPLGLALHTAFAYGVETEIRIRQFRNKWGMRMYLLRYKKPETQGCFISGFGFPLIYHRQGENKTYDYVGGIDNVYIGMMPVMIFLCVLASLRTDFLSALCVIAFFLPIEVVAITRSIFYARKRTELARKITAAFNEDTQPEQVLGI